MADTQRQTLAQWPPAIVEDLNRTVFELPEWDGDEVEGFMHEPVHACPLCGEPMEGGCDEDSGGNHRYDLTDTCYACNLLWKGDWSVLFREGRLVATWVDVKEREW